MRPRVRDWLPLATQQLRLRNLVRIQGLNIAGSTPSTGETLIYYSLHSTKEGAAFYVSEMLPQRHMQQKWAEIVCPEILKSNANCVCIKVWAHAKGSANVTEQETDLVELQKPKEPISALSLEMSNACLSSNKLPRPPDKLLFTWGVYFSGLTLLSPNADAKCNANSLIFQMNGDYFAFSECFTVESLRKQLSLSYARYSASVPKASAAEMSDEFSINSPQVSRSSSPVALDWQNDLLRMSRTRYVQLVCMRSETRKSYDLQKLLHIQELQRLQLQRMRESQEIAAEIKMRSLRCITKEQLLSKRRTTSLSSSGGSSYHQQQHHSMGRTLSILLAEQQEINPHALLQAQQLQRQLETLRCKQRLLQAEHDTYSSRIQQQRERLTQLAEARQQQQLWLERHWQQLFDDEENLAALQKQQVVQQQKKRHIVQNVERRMSSLCMELREIYPIGSNQHAFHTVCGIPFPNMDAYMNDPKYVSSISLENVSPMALNASLGYIAHLVQMIAAIINRPLRNPIIHEGSRSRVVDIIKDLPHASREFPLYSRSTIPSKPVKYAIYLLNQNIAQLCYDITGIRCDIRGTIENILLIFATLAEVEQNQCEPHATTQTHPSRRLTLLSNSGTAMSNNGSGNMDNAALQLSNDSTDCLSKSHSSVDMNHVPVPITTTAATTLKLSTLKQMPSSQPIQIAELHTPQQERVSRSVGSYSDCEDDFREIIEHCYSNSDSNITFQSGRI